MKLFGLDIRRTRPPPAPRNPRRQSRQITITLDNAGGIAGGFGFGSHGGYGRRPYEHLRQDLQWDAGGQSIQWDAWLASRTSELLIAYLSRVEAATLKSGRSGGEVERPIFPWLPEEAADGGAAIAEAWGRYWSGAVAEGPAGPVDGPTLEPIALRTALVDGEIHAVPRAGGLVQVLDADDIRAPDLDAQGRVVRWTYADGQTLPRSAVIQVANLQGLRQVRGRSFIAPALPAALPLSDHQDAAAFGQAVMGKVAAIIETTRDGTLGSLPGMGGRAADVSGLVDDDEEEGASGADNIPTSPISSLQTGSLVVLAPGEKLEAPSYGPPEAALNWDERLEGRVGAALGVSRAELTGDYASHNFASLQVADRKDRATYERIRGWWFRSFRRPLFRAVLPRLLLATDPGLARYGDALHYPVWHGPRLESAQPVRDLEALGKAAELGLVSLEEEARANGQEAMANAKQNATVKAAAAPPAPAPKGGF